ncbi:carcinoembryonic antigen-related cell adhesion molecule 5-like isoform X3 [Hemibagrus wyckioides]|uniref:carcinoembryonic antigen-related cell adhesion molecule 5-like isoform X3 n=1 Tax=Hemibagrus wyckioides TaxID=337641 RepID=UPI00266D8E34|nr:carcinoembryonic antigen-related cell adhesion molecule 5-like isoform X3 [Hemibagrus wyckioides]
MFSRSLLLVLLVLVCLQSFTTAQNQNANGPKTCCVRFQTKPIPVRVITAYEETDIWCSKPGVIFTLKNGGQRCGDPSVEWVKDRMNKIDQRLFNSQTSTETKPTPTVRVNPQSSVYTGDTVTLSCELQQETGWEFLWYRNNQLQSLNSEQENTLKVTVVNAGEREYKCQAIRGNYSTWNRDYYNGYSFTKCSNPVKITVRARPKPVACIDPDNQVFGGETVTLRCDIQDESVSSWQYSWYKDASHSPVSSGQVYRISGVEVTHTGKYTCRGAERGGSRSSHSSDAVTLTVSAKPTPTVRVNPQSSVYTGDTVTLSCELQQGTGWGFLWYRNNQLQNLNSEQENTLKVTVVNAGEREYKCQATRGNYSTEFSDPVKITVRDYNPNGPETCCVGFQNKSIPVRVIASYRVTDLQCTKHGVIFTLKNGGQRCGDPSVEWVKDRMDNINQRLFNN